MTAAPSGKLRLATRTSPLALWQARHVATALATHGVETELVEVVTTGDRRHDVTLAVLGGKGVFVAEVRAAVLDGRADLAIHSAKDLPAEPLDGLVIGAVMERADARDCVVGTPLGDLADGEVVATGSPRRQQLLAAAFPHLRVVGLRGNMATRFNRVGQEVGPGDSRPVRSVLAASAAIDRLGETGRATERLDPHLFIPQVGQGAVAVEHRVDDVVSAAAVTAIDHADTAVCASAERAFLAELGGDCRQPTGAHAVLDTDGRVRLRGFLAASAMDVPLDTSVLIAASPMEADEVVGTDVVALGRGLARALREKVGR